MRAAQGVPRESVSQLASPGRDALSTPSMTMLLKFGRWLLAKFGGAVLIVILGLAAYGLWLFLRDNIDADRRHTEAMDILRAKRVELVKARDVIVQKLADFQKEVEVQQHRAEQASKALAKLRELESWWDRFWGNPVQQKANAEQIEKLSKLARESTLRITEIKRAIRQTNWEKDGAEIEVDRIESEIQRVEKSRSTAVLYLERAWNEAKWYVILALATYFLGPTLWALMMFYGFAVFAGRGRPIRFAESAAALPQVGESHVSIEASLRAGDVLRIKEKYLQASDEGVGKKTRFVLDWKIPFTSLACGLVELVELGGREGPGEYRVTLSNADDPHVELALVEVPEGASLILRPSFLAGVIQRHNVPLQIRRRWQIFRWQAWISGQFRFFEFVGPCRLIVAGSRGVRAEVLAEREGIASPARRTNQDATIGFTPNLDYRPVRAETFWSYYRGMNPLFDDLFAGRGLFILQETATEGAAAKAGRFWSGVWNGVLKVFGL